MRLHSKLALVVGAMALAMAPAALADGPTYTTPEYKQAPPPQAKAYGYYCKRQGQSKKHVKGEKGTAFSRCVKALARAAHHEKMPPGQACKGESKEHVKGQKGTSFSRCVKAVAQLRKDLKEEAQAA